MKGIINNYAIDAAVAVTSSTALVTTGLTSPIAPGQRQRIQIRLNISVGAAGGVRAQLVVPAGGTLFINSIILANVVGAAIVTAQQVASAAFTNALANAGNAFLLMDATIVNGVNAGNIDLQIAQNTSDATPVTAMVGSVMTATIL